MEQVEKTRTVCQLKMKKPTAVIASSGIVQRNEGAS